MSLSHEIIVIGGGLAGTAAAIQSALSGRDVLLVEKEAGPHDKVCGEFLSREALSYLKTLGIDTRALGAASISSVRLAAGRRVAQARLPFPAQSLSRRSLDEALLQRAIHCGVQVVRGQRITALDHSGEKHWIARIGCSSEYHVNHVFLATGKHDLRKWPRPPGRQNDLIAFKMQWQLATGATRDVAGHVELIAFPGGYAGLQLIENGLANLSLLIRRSAFARIGSSWTSLLTHMQDSSEHLAVRLSGARTLWPKPLAISNIPYGYLQQDTLREATPWRLGDQAAVIPSFSGNGMSIALHSARLACETLLCNKPQSDYEKRLRREVGKQVARATFISQALVHPTASCLFALAAKGVPSAIVGVASATRISNRFLVSQLDT